MRCAVVGGGIIGVAVARELSNRLDGAGVTIYEKEDRLGGHQTSHNSGVVHAGLYYEPGGLKATLCRRGIELIRNFCESKSLPYEECGKILIAQDVTEVERLGGVFDRAKANGVPGVRMLTGEQILEVEPNAVGLAALHSPRTAIIDYLAVTLALAEDVVRAGGNVLLSRKVTRVTSGATGAVVATAAGEEGYDLVVVCGGLQSDRLARSSGDDRSPRIIPFFGQYYLLDSGHRDVINGLIYPVPDPKYPFLGVHLTKRIDGEVLVGPNAFIALGRESYVRNRFSARDILAIAAFPGFWKFAARNMPAAVREVQTVLSPRRFAREAERFVPSIKDATLLPGTRGVRAQAMATSGKLVDDFVITQHGRVTHVRNAPSPGATSSMGIAEYIVDRALEARK